MKPIKFTRDQVIIRALSIRQPWAWLILNAGKDIENREWRSNFTGLCLIHAAKTMTRADYIACQLSMADQSFEHITLPAPDKLERGGIVGMVTVDGCVTHSQSPWFYGPFGFKLSDPALLPFTACHGKLGFFRVPSEIVAKLTSVTEVP